MIRQCLVAVGISFLSCASVFAQPADPNASQSDVTFSRLDSNKDGFLSRKEAGVDKDVARIFSKADANKDGKLTEDELIKARSKEDREKAAQYASDSAITAKVKAALLAEKGIPSTAISVETYKGVAQLSGFVEAGVIKRAGAVAAKVGGVKSVKNSLTAK